APAPPARARWHGSCRQSTRFARRRTGPATGAACRRPAARSPTSRSASAVAAASLFWMPCPAPAAEPADRPDPPGPDPVALEFPILSDTGRAETAAASFTWRKLADDVQSCLRHQQQLGDAVADLDGVRLAAAIPARNHQWALVIGIDHPDQVAHHQPALVA